MTTIKTFRDLVAWQKSMELTRMTYRMTAALPADERFGLTSQMRRAAISIPSNIAEGHGRQGRTDYIRYLKTARGSLFELMTQYELATNLHLMPPDPQAEPLMQEVDRILQGLIRSLEQT